MSGSRPAKKSAKAAKLRGPRITAQVDIGTSVESLVEAAESLVTQCRPEEAVSVYETALLQRPGDTQLMDSLASLLADMGDEERARELFQSSAAINPDNGHGKWMHLGQMSEGKSAVDAYRKGITILEGKLERLVGAAASSASSSAAAASSSSSSSSSSASDDEVALLRRELSNAYCSVAEMYMLPDLCDEDDAEAQAVATSEAALEADPDNPEAFSVAAAVRIAQQQPKEAAELLVRGFELLEALAASDEVVGRNEEEEEEVDDAATGPAAAGGGAPSAATSASRARAAKLFGLPPYDLRKSMAQACSEVELYEQAGDIFDALLAEDDTDMEIWFLAAEARFLAGELEDASDLAVSAAAMVGAAINTLKGAGKGGSKKGSFGQARTSTAFDAASAVAPLGFTFAAMENLMNTAPVELNAQHEKFVEMCTAVQGALEQATAAAAAAGTGPAAAGAAGGEEDEEDDDEDEGAHAAAGRGAAGGFADGDGDGAMGHR